ncbi:MAG: ATP synthase F1 subunit epsilon [Candidatus Dadabacteria bacterium]|nr:ATP synthase F1 subunit epsilon [Candidatus Dadabacteria bacterium]MDE0663538.1 ATP synthase F1 subunit epsilon [Candidatus Dadabacteria bacterium]
MAEKLRLKIITPERLVFDGEVEELVAPGQMGEFGVLPGHVPFLSVLFPGRLRFKTEESGESTLIIHGGLADVKDDTISILTDQPENPEEVDVAAARKDAEVFQKEIDELQDTEASEREELDRKLRIARARTGE